MLELTDIYGGYGKRMIINGVSARFSDGEITSIIEQTAAEKALCLCFARDF